MPTSSTLPSASSTDIESGERFDTGTGYAGVQPSSVMPSRLGERGYREPVNFALSIIGVVLGAAGSLGAVGAWLVAAKANRLAAQANTLAKEANRVAQQAAEASAEA